MLDYSATARRGMIKIQTLNNTLYILSIMNSRIFFFALLSTMFKRSRVI